MIVYSGKISETNSGCLFRIPPTNANLQAVPQDSACAVTEKSELAPAMLSENTVSINDELNATLSKASVSGPNS